MDSLVDRKIVQAIYKTVADTVKNITAHEDRKIVVTILRNEEESTETEQNLEFYGCLLSDVVNFIPILKNLPPFSYPTVVVINATGTTVTVGSVVIPS
jgi:hypothetical protein